MSKAEMIKKKALDRLFKMDEFIKRIRHASAGAINMGNIWCMDYAIANLPSDAPMVEIGSFCGLSANVMTYLKFKHKVKNALFCIDPWDYNDGNEQEKLGEHPTLSKKQYSELIQRRFKENVLLFSGYDLPYAFQMASEEFFLQWRDQPTITDIFDKEITLGGKISFAYIDGNHDYEYVQSDFQNVDQNLEIGGFILFDDSADNAGWGSCDLVKEICNDPRYKLIKQSPNYFFQKVQDD